MLWQISQLNLMEYFQLNYLSAQKHTIHLITAFCKKPCSWHPNYELILNF